MKRSLVIAIIVTGLILGNSSSSSAAIILSFTQAGPFTEGQFGLVDLWIESDSADALDAFFVNVSITPQGASPADGLIFDTPQTDAQFGSDYVFDGVSASEGFGGIYADVEETQLAAFDTTTNGIPVPINTPRLLLRMNVFAAFAGTYDIAVKTNGDLFDTEFLADGVNNSSDIAFTPDSMSITVNAAAVPEPATGFVCGLVAVSAVLWKRRRRLTPDVVEV
jgi:hypothetical protein